jgi:hypothetical protein
VERLARRRALTPGLIARLGRIAPATPEAAAEAANAAQEAALGDLAQRLPAGPGWEDLALPDRLAGALRDLAHEIETRAEVWADPAVARVFRREAGLVAVMHGPPGTGKTMGAQVVAAAAGRDLFRVDCATVVSKYIGETSKNLRALFDRARGLDAVLFFDEADALFARRTEVRDSHDRYANTDTAELLQLVEGALEGCVILATNRLGDVDPAFLRRIRYVFEFPRPDAAARTAIWVRAGVVLAPQMEATVWQRLAQALELTGAQIKTTLLAAHFAARRQGRGLALPDLVAAAERELAKEGRGLGAREREMLRHA